MPKQGGQQQTGGQQQAVDQGDAPGQVLEKLTGEHIDEIVPGRV